MAAMARPIKTAALRAEPGTLRRRPMERRRRIKYHKLVVYRFEFKR
jgi:hypothetical protein